jgi:hypothetical protein
MCPLGQPTLMKQKITSIGEDVEKLKLLYTLVGMKKVRLL